MEAKEVKPLIKDFDINGFNKYWVYYPISRKKRTTTPEPVETFYLQTAQGDNLQTAQGDNILWTT